MNEVLWFIFVERRFIRKFIESLRSATLDSRRFVGVHFETGDELQSSLTSLTNYLSKKQKCAIFGSSRSICITYCVKKSCLIIEILDEI